MQNDQEHLLMLYSSKSMGGPYLFAPDEYRKGNAVREPADLVWVCNGCIILMYTCRNEPQTEPTKIESVRQEAVKHNLRQASGWLRAWRKGQPLTGRNHHGRFHIPYSAVQHVVVLSIISCTDGQNLYHHQESVDLGVTLCATVTQKVIERLAESGTSALDLVDFIDHLRRHFVVWSETEALNQVQNYVASAITTAGLAFTPGDAISQKFTWGLSTILSSRNFAPSSKTNLGELVHNGIGEGQGAALLNDISLSDLCRVVVLLLKHFDHMTADSSETLFQVVPLSYYSYGICVVPLLGSVPT